MKRYLLVLVMMMSVVLIARSQRTAGNTRDPNGRQGEARPVERAQPAPPSHEPIARNSEGRPQDSRPIESPQPQEQHPDPGLGGTYPYPPCPVPVILVDGLPSPPPVIIVSDPVVEPDRPQFSEAVLRDYHIAPRAAGLDFSSEEVLPYDNKTADVYFSVTDDGPEFVVGHDADIQDLGQDVPFPGSEAIPSNDWSQTHRVYAEPENVYVIWTWDNQYYKIRVVSESDSRISIEWLKMACGARIAANEDYRTGVSHRDSSVMFGQ